jgi:hypothetical protein
MKIRIKHPIYGVPITYLNNYCPKQFEIVGTISAPCDPDTMNLGKDYSNFIGTLQNGSLNGRTGSTFGKCPVLIMDDKIHPYYVNNEGIKVQTVYHRLFIKQK